MKKRTRNILIGVVVVVLLVEVGARLFSESSAIVEVVNTGSAPIENLRISCGRHEAIIERIEVGKRGGVFMPGRSKSILKLRFKQPKNVMSQMQFDDYDPRTLELDREKFVIELSDDGYRPSTEETGAEEANVVERALANIKRWLDSFD
jgi:hypothetical protein